MSKPMKKGTKIFLGILIACVLIGATFPMIITYSEISMVAKGLIENVGDFVDPIVEEEEPVVRSKRSSSFIPAMNLESGMPVVDEAVSRMRLGIQQMRSSGIRVVKLIHGYGSTGTGGRIRVGVRSEMDGMKRKKMIRDYISGEHFGPFDESSRKLVELNKNVAADPDYGRGNQGITIVWI